MAVFGVFVLRGVENCIFGTLNLSSTVPFSSKIMGRRVRTRIWQADRKKWGQQQKQCNQMQDVWSRFISWCPWLPWINRCNLQPLKKVCFDKDDYCTLSHVIMVQWSMAPSSSCSYLSNRAKHFKYFHVTLLNRSVSFSNWILAYDSTWPIGGVRVFRFF